MSVILKLSLTFIVVSLLPFLVMIADVDDDIFSPPWHGYKLNEASTIFEKLQYWIPTVTAIVMGSGLVLFIFWVILKLIWRL